MRNDISEPLKIKISWGCMPTNPPSGLRRSHKFPAYSTKMHATPLQTMKQLGALSYSLRKQFLPNMTGDLCLWALWEIVFNELRRQRNALVLLLRRRDQDENSQAGSGPKRGTECGIAKAYFRPSMCPQIW